MYIKKIIEVKKVVKNFLKDAETSRERLIHLLPVLKSSRYQRENGGNRTSFSPG